jgi:arylsulfatase
MLGKAHLTPKWETGPNGPFNRWPTGLGFEYFYGFLDGDTDQFAPQLYLGTDPVEPPDDDPNYILDKDMADRATGWLKRQNAVQPDKPFFLYYAPGTAHSPHQAPKEWIDRFRGRFDMGWDKLREITFAEQKRSGTIPANAALSARPDEIPAWNSVSPEKQKLFVRMMETYAGAVAYADDQIGRLIDEIARSGELDNTLVIFVQGDNGSSAEGNENGLFNEMSGINEDIEADYPAAQANIDNLGGPLTYGHFPVGWAHAMSTPFPYFKRVASHLGATRNAMVLSWPSRAPDAKGEVRPQFHHVIDIAPTILEATGIKRPTSVAGVKQMPFDGVSMIYSLFGADKPALRKTQFFEISSDAAIYSDGWMANTRPNAMPWQFTGVTNIPFDKRIWELYDLKNDFSQSRDLAAENPEKLKQMQKLFQREARANSALPIARMPPGLPSPDINQGRSSFTFPIGVQRLTPAVAPDVRNRSFSLLADVMVSTEGAQGMLVTQGGRFGGYGLYLRDGVPRFVYNKFGTERSTIDWGSKLAPGRHQVRLDFDYDGGGLGKGGKVKLSVDGADHKESRIPSTIRFMFPLSETFDVGEDTGTPVAEDYRVPFRFDDKNLKVTVILR